LETAKGLKAAGYKICNISQVLVAHAYNPSYSRGKDQEDCSSRPIWANSSVDPISKIPNTKRAGGVAQVVEHLLSKCEALGSSPIPQYI
jgi:hypothetical protein